jgi:CBS domain-containing protein
MIVEQCMSKSPRVCTSADSLSNAARTLWECDLGALPVVDHAGAVVGMITDRDLCMAAYTSGLPLHATSVGRHMSRTVFSIGAKADTTKAAELMKSRKVRRLPVVENGRLVGMVTLSDLARSAGRNGKLRGLDPEQLAGVLASVCEPRVLSNGAAAPVAGSTRPKVRRVKSVLQPKPRGLAKKR